MDAESVGHVTPWAETWPNGASTQIPADAEDTAFLVNIFVEYSSVFVKSGFSHLQEASQAELNNTPSRG
jgi:hypothetical protein